MGNETEDVEMHQQMIGKNKRDDGITRNSCRCTCGGSVKLTGLVLSHLAVACLVYLLTLWNSTCGSDNFTETKITSSPLAGIRHNTARNNMVSKFDEI